MRHLSQSYFCVRHHCYSGLEVLDELAFRPQDLLVRPVALGDEVIARRECGRRPDLVVPLAELLLASAAVQSTTEASRSSARGTTRSGLRPHSRRAITSSPRATGRTRRCCGRRASSSSTSRPAWRSRAAAARTASSPSARQVSKYLTSWLFDRSTSLFV